MADFNFEEIKTTLMGGYDKEDVQNKISSLIDKYETEASKKDKEIEELKKSVSEKEEQISAKNSEIDKLNKDIGEKYQGYIDNYNTIGKIVYETRIQSEKTLDDARIKGESIIAEANKKAQLSIDKAQEEVDKRIVEGKKKYDVLQEEINELLQLVNQVQHKFMQSFKAIHEISGAMNDEDGSEFDIELDEGFEDEE
ncbi:MAG: coiled-coil domain-containing protein [Candidatus Alectryocaccobium sp.]|jgi:chromosome segregation ATPase